MFVLLSRLFIAALWSSEGKGLTYWLLFVMFIVILLLSRLYPGTGVVLDCIHSGSLLSFFTTLNLRDPCLIFSVVKLCMMVVLG